MAHQRSTSDFFIPDNLREDLQRKAEAILQTFANSTLPPSVEYFHSLVALDTSNHKGPSTLGFPTSVYKATSSRDGHTYALRRVEGFRLTSEAAIRTVHNWKRISSSSLVQVHDAFTGKWFNDSSLIIVMDYHPLSQTLADKHFPIGRQRATGGVVAEPELWSYISQIASALKAVHDAGQAAQTVQPTKILITSKNRIRLSGCGVPDIVQFEQRRPLIERQRSDLEDFGRLILGIATRNQHAHHNIPKALELVSRSYTERLRASIAWLLSPAYAQDNPDPEHNISAFLGRIADKLLAAFDSALHYEDTLLANLGRELENARLLRILAKLNVILERPPAAPADATAPSHAAAAATAAPSAWSETGERYYLKLFRDYVFHQVDGNGRPAVNLGHIVACLNKLDAGVEEKIQLVSRDEQNLFVVSYREVKRGFEGAWAELTKAAAAGTGAGRR